MKEINIYDLKINPFEDFGKNWMALAAGNEEKGYNAMTIAWGHMGSLWERKTHANRLPTIVCYVRPNRYTKEFLDREELFTLTLFEENYRNRLGYLGSHTGRDTNKMEECGLTPVFDRDTVYFEEGKIVYICRKLYHAPLMENGFVDNELIDFNYPKRDFHEMYVGEIVKVLRRGV